MARRVFFSFHYEKDVRRIQQVRQSWVVRPEASAQPFYDAAEFETVKRRVGGIQNWIDEQLRGTSVTAVLFGAETYSRPWVLYEIRRSHELGKGLLAINLRGVKDPVSGLGTEGPNPLSYVTTTQAGRTAPLSTLYPAYDWVAEGGYSNIETWIERAAAAAGR